MQPSIMTEQLLAIQNDAKKTLAGLTPEERRELKELWVKAQNLVVGAIITNLEAIYQVDLQPFIDRLDKFRILNHFLNILDQVEDEATDG